jgi:hypothetical protein
MDEYINRVFDQMQALELIDIDENYRKVIINNICNIPNDVLQDMERKELCGLILSNIGSGVFNYETGEWKPSSNTIYAFDMEAFQIDRMYTLFLEGVSSIVSKDISIIPIAEDINEVDYEMGSGIQRIRFLCNSEMYQYDAAVEDDWFDSGMIAYMNEVLKKQNNGKQLWVTSDGYQACILFYNTKEWADNYAECMGYYLE